MEQEAQRKQAAGKRKAMGLKEDVTVGLGVQLRGRPLAQDTQGKVQRLFLPSLGPLYFPL